MPGGFRCAPCAGDRAYFLPSKRLVYECAGCGRQVSVIAGTIFEQSKQPLVLWFRAIFEVTASKQGVSAAELQRKLGLGSYQTAWSWLTKIRTAMVRPNREPLAGEVEIDESYVGGPEPGKPGRAAEDKAIVAAAVERGKSCGRVRLGVIANVSADVLTAFVDNHLGDGETAHTDGWRGYAQLGNTGYRHIINTGYRHIISVLSKLDQTAAEVLPRVHLIFSLLKRWILGTHQRSVSLKHLDGYLEEFTFRLYGALGCQAPNVDAVLLHVPTSRRRQAGGSVHDGLRGARHRARIIAPQACIRSIGVNPDHDAAMRISGEASGGGPNLQHGLKTIGRLGSP